MGDKKAEPRPMDWQGTLGQMQAHGTRVAMSCDVQGCEAWTVLDLDVLLAAHGPAWMLWDRKPPCPRCGGAGHYMASPGPTTPYRPLRGGVAGMARRSALFRQIGFSRRDVARIRAFAERVKTTWPADPLNDLDVAYIVTARLDLGHPLPPAFDHLGRWVGREILWREMNAGECGVWDRRPRLFRSV